MVTKDKETRALGEICLAPSEDTQSRKVSGYAAVFNRFSEDFGDWREIIEPGAFDGVIEASDVLCLLNHDAQRGLLARSRNGEGSLQLSIDETGLRYEFEAPNTPLGDELMENLRRGDVSQSSFAFTVQDERWEKRDGAYIRHINKVERLYDVSPVYTPAYPDTSVANRGLDTFKAAEQPKEEIRESIPASYYAELRKKI